MSHTYIANGYVDIRVNIKDMEVSASNSSNADDIAELVLMRISDNWCGVEIKEYGLIIDK